MDLKMSQFNLDILRYLERFKISLFVSDISKWLKISLCPDMDGGSVLLRGCFLHLLPRLLPAPAAAED